MRNIGQAPSIQDILKAVPFVSNWLAGVTEKFKLYSGVNDPTAAEIPKGQWVVYKNTTLNEVRLWVNDNGTLKKSVPLT